MSDTGKRGEELAAEHYQKLGYKILERNFVFRHGTQVGELDLVAGRGNELVFVEVKTRRSGKYGTPFDSVDIYKQRKLVKMVKLYLRLHPEALPKNYRIDVAAVDIDNPVNPVIILTNAIEDTN